MSVIIEVPVTVPTIYGMDGIGVPDFYRVAPCRYIPKDWVHILFTKNGAVDAIGIDEKYFQYVS